MRGRWRLSESCGKGAPTPRPNSRHNRHHSRRWAGQATEFDSHDVDEEGIGVENPVEDIRFSARAKLSVPASDSPTGCDVVAGQGEEKSSGAALDLNESDSYAHFGLGDIYTVAGRKAEALAQYQAGLVKDPTNAQVLAAVQKLREQIPGIAP